MQFLGVGRIGRAGRVAGGCFLLLALGATGAAAQGVYTDLFASGTFGADGQAVDTRPFSITPMAGLQETFTDNALLTSTNKQADLITRPMVGAQLNARGPFTANVIGHAYYDAYLNEGQLSGFSGDAQGTASYALIPSFLALEGDVYLTNGSVSTFGTPAVNRVGTANQATIATYDIGPHLTTTVDDFADLDVVGRFAQVFFGNPQGSTANVPFNSTILEGAASLDTGTRYLGYQSVTTAQVQADDNDFQAYGAQQTFYVSIFPQLRLIARGGYDSVTQPGIVDIKEGMWSGGAEWIINQQSRVSVERGERFGHAAWRGELHLQLSGQIFADGRYFEAVQPSQLQLNSAFTSFVSPTAQLPVQLANPSFTINGNLDDQTALAKIAELHLVYQGNGDTIELEGNWNDRLLLALNARDRSLVTGINYGRDLAPDLRLQAGVNYYRTFANPFYGENEGVGGNFALEYAINPTLRGVAGYAYQRQDLLVPGNSGYSENVLYVALGKRF